MHLKSLYISYLLIITFHFCGIQFTFAQPGDHPFSVVTFDASGYHTNFKIYSCSAKYPYSSERSDSLEVVWKPDLKSLKIIDTLELVEITNETLRFPYSHYFRGKSCLTTNILMIIRDNTDTMLISTAGADPYALLLNHTSNEHNLPFLYPFQRGLFYLQKLISNLSAKSLFFLAHRDYFLNYYSSPKQVISMPSENHISYLKMNKQIYNSNDTISIVLTGTVLNNGGCGGGSIIWTLQKLENENWIIVTDNCCDQMDCGIGPSRLHNTTIPLFLLKDNINERIATYPMQRKMTKGKYRVIVYDDIYQLYFSDAFYLE